MKHGAIVEHESFCDLRDDIAEVLLMFHVGIEGEYDDGAVKSTEEVFMCMCW